MDPVSGLGQIMRLLQRRLAENRRRSEGLQPTGGEPGAPARRGTPAAAKPSTEEIRRRIGERIRMLEPADRRGPRAAQILVESVLVWEFGDDVLDDPEFAELTQQVRTVMTEDPEVWSKFQVVLDDF